MIHLLEFCALSFCFLISFPLEKIQVQTRFSPQSIAPDWREMSKAVRGLFTDSNPTVFLQSKTSASQQNRFSKCLTLKIEFRLLYGFSKDVVKHAKGTSEKAVNFIHLLIYSIYS